MSREQIADRMRYESVKETAPQVDRWELLRMMTRGREDLGLSNRELTVLQALLSFLPDNTLGAKAQMVVFASNKTLCDRLNGMPCSTMRRHLARLVDLGFVQRCDSPNGKRYCRRSRDGMVAFGLDLSPLPHRLSEISDADLRSSERRERIRATRESIALLRRDIIAMANQDSPNFDKIDDQLRLSARMLRRKLTVEELNVIADDLRQTVCQLRDSHEEKAAPRAARQIGCSKLDSSQMSTRDQQNEQHIQSSNKDILESEEAATRPPSQSTKRISLTSVLAACPEVQSFAVTPLRTWREFVDVVATLRPGIQIDDQTWHDAIHTMGHEEAAIVLAAMLEKFNSIRSPAAYFRSLTLRARNGTFTPVPMVTALLNRHRGAA